MRRLGAALFGIVMVAGTGCAAPVTSATSNSAASASSVPSSMTAPVSEPSTRTSRPADTSSTARSSSDSTTNSGTSAVAATTAEPSTLQSAQCYFSADVEQPDNSVGLAFGFKEGGAYDNTVSVLNYLDACHQSLVSKHTIDDADPVAACVLADGRVGVFPGTEEVCNALGLPSALRSASEPVTTG